MNVIGTIEFVPYSNGFEMYSVNMGREQIGALSRFGDQEYHLSLCEEDESINTKTRDLQEAKFFVVQRLGFKVVQD